MKASVFLKGLFYLFVVVISAIQGTAEIGDYIIRYTCDDADTSGSIAIDSAELSNGTITGATTGVTGIINEAYDYELADSTDELDSNYGTMSQVVTVSIWVKPESWNAGADTMISWWQDANHYANFHQADATNITFTYIRGAADKQCDLRTALPTVGSWTHLVVQIETNWCGLFVNGTQVMNDTSVNTDTYDAITGNVVFGQWVSFTRPFDGVIDDIRIYNRTLSASEILDIYNEFGARTINQSSYNVTSATQNATIWRTNTSFPVPVQDSTPTVTFNINNAGNCSIGTGDQNFTDMTTEDSNRKCGTTDVTEHTCTLPSTDNLARGNQSIYLSCVGSAGVEAATSTSGDLAINLTNAAPTVPTSILCNDGSCNISAAGNVKINCSGSTDAENDTLTYIIDKGNQTGGGVAWEQIGSHAEDSFLVWDITGETVGESYEFFRCVAADEIGNSTSYNISSELNISALNLTLLFDGVNDSRKYELQYVGNITGIENFGYGCISTDHPDWGVNVSCGSAPLTLLFNISNMSIRDFNGSSSVVISASGGVARIISSNKSELANLQVNITGINVSGFPVNITLQAEGNETDITLIGELRSNVLYIDSYTESGTEKTTGDILFVRAGTKTITFELNQPRVNGTLVLNLTGDQSNAGNEFDSLERFTNVSGDASTTNILLVDNNARHVYDNLTDSDLGAILWSEDETTSCAGFGCSNDVTFTYGSNDYIITSTIVSADPPPSTSSQGRVTTAEPTFDMKDFLGVEFNMSFDGTCTVSPGSCGTNTKYDFDFIISDGNSTVGIYDVLTTAEKKASTTSIAEAPVRVDLIENSDGDVIRAEVYRDDTLVENTSLSSLNQDNSWDIRMQCIAYGMGLAATGKSICRVLNKFYVYGLTHSNISIQDASYESEVVKNTSNNITSAVITWVPLARDNYTEFVAQGGTDNESSYNFTVELSADNGTNYQEVQSSVTEVFDTPGKYLRYRINFSMSDLTLVPIVGRVRVQIVPSSLDNFTIDVGNDGENDYNVSILNTTTVITISNAAIRTACNSGLHEACNVSIKYGTDGSGLLTTNSFNYTHDPNPIEFTFGNQTLTFMQNTTNPGLQLNFTNGNITLDDFDLRYWGIGNITVNLSVGSSLQSHILMMRYSRLVLSSIMPWFELNPSTLNSKNVEPEGQRSKFNESIFNVSAHLNNVDDANLTYQFNNTIHSCAVLFASNESDMSPSYVLPNNQTRIVPLAWSSLNNSGEERRIFVKSNFTSCNASNSRYYDPYNFFNIVCVECVTNDLNNGTVTG